MRLGYTIDYEWIPKQKYISIEEYEKDLQHYLKHECRYNVEEIKVNLNSFILVDSKFQIKIKLNHKTEIYNSVLNEIEKDLDVKNYLILILLSFKKNIEYKKFEASIRDLFDDKIIILFK